MDCPKRLKMNITLKQLGGLPKNHPLRFTITDDSHTSILFSGDILECESWIRIKERSTKLNVTIEK